MPLTKAKQIDGLLSVGDSPAGQAGFIAPIALKAERVGEYLDISKAEVWKWLASGFLPDPVLRHGRVVRWSRQEIRRWFESGCPSRERWIEIRRAWTDWDSPDA